MRRLLWLCCTCLACTRFNPAFDEPLGDGESGDDTRGDTSMDSSEAESESSSESPDDLPAEPTCAHQPAPGLAIRFGDPTYFGGNCPNGVDVWAKVSTAAAGEASLAVCSEGCTDCFGEHPLSAYPMIITDYLPQSDGCVILQASVPYGQESSTCIWGALSIHDPLTGTPHVIATAHSAEPTPYGTQVLAGLIPDPLKATSCNCDTVGQANDCCYQAEGPPEFWYYPFGDVELFPGEYVALDIPNQAGLQHYFKLYQAERLHSCESHDLQLSWAVLAEP